MPITNDVAVSLIEFELNVILVGALLIAAVFTSFASVKEIFPVPTLPTSAVTAVLT